MEWRRGNFPKEKDNELYQIKADGFYRFFATNLTMTDPYILQDNPAGVADGLTQKHRLFIGDDTQLPNLLVNITGRPNKKVTWGFDIFAFQFLDGNINPTYNAQIPTEDRPSIFDPLSGNRLGQNMGLNLGLNLYGSYLTKYGTFNMRVGGIHWFSMSDLTLGSFTGYNRFTLSERAPWDPIGKDIGVRYQQMYEFGAVYQDLRFGERAIQGAIFEGINLPGGWSFAALYGKTELAGGFMTIPNINYGGKIKKVYKGDSYVSIQNLNNLTWIDSLNTEQAGFNMLTAEWKTSFGGFDVKAEAGMGRYVSPSGDFPWGEAISAKILATEKVLPFPLELHYYRISPDVINNNAIFWNTSIQEARAAVDQVSDDGTQSANVLIPFASSMVAIGQMTNNRTGVNLNTDLKFGKVKISAGYGVSQEIDAIDGQNTITFSHTVNQLTRARFWRWTFPPDVGPYGRYDKVYRDAFQKVEITDADMGKSVEPRGFNQVEVHAKYRDKIKYRNFYAFLLGRYNTAQPGLSVIAPFNNDAYIRQYSTELEMFYQIAKPIFINTYAGVERIIGNDRTLLNFDTELPLNQTGYGFGGGLDISLSRNAGLFLRHRWFFFEDENFPLDRFEGQESMVELKVFF